jgi:putative ABC transport system permease protein
MASFRPATVLKGEHERAGKKLRLRSVLVVSQFIVSVILITGTIIVQKQLHFIQNKNLGFDREQVLITHKTDDLGSQLGVFKHELLKNPAISSVSNSDTLIGEIFSDDIYRQAGQPKEENQSLRIYRIDPHFIDTYKIKMVQGHFFPKDYQDYRRGIVLNESAVKILGLSNPLNQKIIDIDGNEYRVIGVVKDFHFESLQHKIKPLAFHSLGPKSAARYLSVRMATTNIRDTISQIQGTWDKIAGGQAFEYEFFDDHFAKIYLAEKKTGEIFLIFSILAIIIACLGLFGLTSCIAEQRTKEMGIRKVLGASVIGIIFLLIKQFSKWVVLANLLAWPIAYIVLNRWLENFAYRTNLALWIFIFSGVISLIITLLTVSYQATKTATLNPVKTLKYE